MITRFSLPMLAVLTIGCTKPTHPLPIAIEPAQIEAELKRIQLLEDALDSGGAQKAFATGLPCPVFHSRYYAERVAQQQPKLRKLEEARRSFGLKLARALDDIGERFQQPTTSEERAGQATLALELATWTRGAQGYGNYSLFTKCEGLATVPLAFLVADLTFSLETIRQLRARIIPLAEERAFRVAILNDEAPRPFIDSPDGSDSEQNRNVNAAWKKGERAMMDWFQKRNITMSDWNRNMLPDELAYYLDDGYSAPFTAANLWERKLHGRLAGGFRDVQIRNVDYLLLFREKVGVFPTTPPDWWSPGKYGQTAIEVAFEVAWRPILMRTGSPNGTAAKVYEQVSEARFMDRETQEIQEEAARRARREKRH